MSKDKIRYGTRCTISGIKEIGGNSYFDIDGAIKEIELDAHNPEITNQILIDVETKTVEIVKGDTVQPFTRGLNHQHPGWKLGTIQR